MLDFFELHQHAASDTQSVIAIVIMVSTILAMITVFASLFKLREGTFSWSELLIGIGNLVALSLVGAVAGYTGGLSRVGVVGEVIPAALSIIGGLAIYLFGVKKVESGILPIAVIAFAGSLFIGFAESANKRAHAESFGLIEQKCFNLYLNIETLSSDSLQLIDKRYGEHCSEIMSATFRNAKGPK